MDLLADISQCGARGEDERLLEVSLSIRTLQIDPHEVQSLPDPVREHIHVETLLRGDGTKSVPTCFFTTARYCSLTRSTLLRTTSAGTYLLFPVNTSINWSSLTSSRTRILPLLTP